MFPSTLGTEASNPVFHTGRTFKLTLATVLAFNSHMCLLATVQVRSGLEDRKGTSGFKHFFNYYFWMCWDLHCCVWAFSSWGEQGLLFVAVCGLFLAMASLVAAHGLQNVGSVVVAHGLSHSVTCGIFPDQGLNPCPLHWQVDS